MKKPRHNGKILVIVIIGVIVVFAAGIGLGIVTGKKVQDSQKVTSNDAAGKAEQDKNSAAQQGDASNTDKDNGTKDPANNNTGTMQGIMPAKELTAPRTILRMKMLRIKMQAPMTLLLLPMIRQSTDTSI